MTSPADIDRKLADLTASMQTLSDAYRATVPPALAKLGRAAGLSQRETPPANLD